MSGFKCSMVYSDADNEDWYHEYLEDENEEYIEYKKKEEKKEKEKEKERKKAINKLVQNYFKRKCGVLIELRSDKNEIDKYSEKVYHMNIENQSYPKIMFNYLRRNVHKIWNSLYNMFTNTPLNILNGTPSGVPLDVSSATLPFLRTNQLKSTVIFDYLCYALQFKCTSV